MFDMHALLLDDALCVVNRNRLVFSSYFEDNDISQGSVAIHLRCGGIFTDSIITNFILILTVKTV